MSTKLTLETLSPKVLLVAIIFLIGAPVQAVDKARELDVAYSKFVQMLPQNSQLIAQPYAEKLASYGKKAKSVVDTNSDAVGGKSLVVDVRKSKHAYDAGVTLPIFDSIEKGDVIYMAFFAKAKRLPKSRDTILIPGVSVQQSSEPYASIFSHQVELTENWQTFVFAAKADKNRKAGSMQASFQIASDNQEIEFGPVFIFNVGKNADLASLPFLTQ